MIGQGGFKGKMRFEISMEGPLDLLEAVSRELGLARGPKTASGIHDGDAAGSGGRLVLEETEASLNTRLSEAAGAVDRVEKRFGVQDRVVFEVRNRSYGEPPTGGNRPRDPFRPVPSVEIQPWYPGVSTGGAAVTGVVGVTIASTRCRSVSYNSPKIAA